MIDVPKRHGRGIIINFTLTTFSWFWLPTWTYTKVLSSIYSVSISFLCMKLRFSVFTKDQVSAMMTQIRRQRKVDELYGRNKD